MTTAQTVGAVSRDAAEWFAIDWQAVNRNVRRLQVRIVQLRTESCLSDCSSKEVLFRLNLVFHDEHPTSHGRKVTTGQKALGQRILQPQGWHPNCEGTVQLLASRRQRARVNSMVSICKLS
jgi:hypothetical protein